MENICLLFQAHSRQRNEHTRRTSPTLSVSLSYGDIHILNVINTFGEHARLFFLLFSSTIIFTCNTFSTQHTLSLILLFSSDFSVLPPTQPTTSPTLRPRLRFSTYSSHITPQSTHHFDNQQRTTLNNTHRQNHSYPYILANMVRSAFQQEHTFGTLSLLFFSLVFADKESSSNENKVVSLSWRFRSRVHPNQYYFT